MDRSLRYQEVPSTPRPNPSGQVDLHSTLMGTFILVLPLLIAVGANLRKRHRAFILRKQIAALEQLWQVNLTRDDCH